MTTTPSNPIQSSQPSTDDLQAPTLLALEAREAGYKKRIEELECIVRQMVEAYDSGNLRMSSPEIGEPENNIPLHPWHEELLYYARTALHPKSDQ